MLTITQLVYPAYLLIAFTLTVIFIPRNKYRRYFICGFLVGCLGDVIIVFILQNLLHVMFFTNQGMFYVLKLNALSPLGWTLTMILFLYFLPSNRWFQYPYIATWAFCSLSFAYILRNAGLYDFVPWLYPIPISFLFLGWYSFAAWVFKKSESLQSTEN